MEIYPPPCPPAYIGKTGLLHGDDFDPDMVIKPGDYGEIAPSIL